MTPRVSVLLLTWNGATTLPAVLDGIAGQRATFPVETVAVDSGSTDGTVDLLERRVDRLVRIPNDRFNHGLTRNLGIEHCRGDLVVLLVQDAVPASDGWLAALTEPLFRDARLAGTYARQVIRPDASAITRYHLGNWIATSEAPRTSFLTDRKAFFRLPPREQFLLCVFDDVCSCVRRSVWRERPFRATAIAEDLEWARDVLLAGYGLAYVPAAAVIHSHERSARYEFRRAFLVHQRLRALFGFRSIPTLLHLIAAIGGTFLVHLRLLGTGPYGPRSRGAETARALALAVAWPLGQYLGGLPVGRGFLAGRWKGV